MFDFFFFKQKTAYEMRISDWSSDVCSSDLLGFTHLELLPVSEYPFDGSWGYQPTGLFAPTSRFGPPEGFKRFMDNCHEAGLGVLVDWVPGHFPTDAHGLVYFDGTHLYEHADPRQGLHMDWDTLISNRTEDLSGRK